MRKVILTVITMLAAMEGISQPAQKTSWNDPLLPLYLIVAFVFVVLVVVIITAVYLIKVLNLFTKQAEKTKAQQFEMVYKPGPSWWSKFTQRVNASVPVEQEKIIELDHNYDGIKELDNHLPPWWKWLFYGTIVWSVVYVIVFHFSNLLPLSIEEYQNEVAVAEEQARKIRAAQPQAVIDENALQFTHDAVIIEKGKSVFMSNNCGSCHRNDGGGNTIGPNLTDEFWLHGGDIKNVFATIKNGVVEKGMPAWGKAMSPEDVRNVTFFVMSLQGTKPVDAKAPQGEKFTPEPIKIDSTTVQASL